MAATDATLTAKTSPLERPTLGCMNLPCWEDTYVMNDFFLVLHRILVRM